MNIVKANRTQSKIRLGLQAAAGFGKSYSALLIAYGLCGAWNKVVVIDSESGSSHLYSDLGDYSVVSLSKPFSPERYIQAIELCEQGGYEVIIIDSISHEWEGQGGILDIHSNMVGNSFTNWSKVTPRHNSFVQAILQSKAHVIATIRTKSDYVLSEKNGKMVPEKVGLKGITKEGLDYEFTIVLDLDSKSNATASKDRTKLFNFSLPFVPTEKTGSRIRQWCEMNISQADIMEKIEACTSEEEIRKVYELAGPYKESLKHHFKEKWNKIIIQNTHSNGTTDSK